MIAVAVVDDHPATASGLAALLAHEQGLRVVGTAGSAAEAVELCDRLRPDVVIVDIQMGGRPVGLELVHRFARAGGPAVILFSAYDYPGFHARALELGARGFLAKTASLAEIVDAVRLVAGGGTAFSASVIADASGAPRAPSERELEVIGLVARGFSNDEVGARLEIAEKSVESHLRRLFARYGVMTRTELSLLAAREGWIDIGRVPGGS